MLYIYIGLSINRLAVACITAHVMDAYIKAYDNEPAFSLVICIDRAIELAIC